MRTTIDRTMRGGSYRREHRRGYHESTRPRARLGSASAIPAKPENVHEIGSTPHGAARLNPGLKIYYERLPRPLSHYGGYYTMTKENWPLIGPAGPDGSFVVGALSGFGTMAACAAGYLAAALATGADVPDHAGLLGLSRYEDPDLIAHLEAIARRSIL